MNRLSGLLVFLATFVVVVLTGRTAEAAPAPAGTLTVTTDHGNPVMSVSNETVHFTLMTTGTSTNIDVRSGGANCAAGGAPVQQPVAAGGTATIGLSRTTNGTTNFCLGPTGGPYAAEVNIVWTIVPLTFTMTSNHGSTTTPGTANVNDVDTITLSTNLKEAIFLRSGGTSCSDATFEAQATPAGGIVTFMPTFTKAGMQIFRACASSGLPAAQAAITTNVAGRPTTIAVTGAPGPVSLVYGAVTTLSATVTSTDTVNGGTVTFTATNGAAAASTYTCTIAAGTCTTMSITDLAAGPHDVSAKYEGDAQHATSTSTASLALEVTKAASTVTAVSSSQNPQLPATPVTFTAIVTSAGTPTGSVVFKDGAVALGCATAPITTTPQTVSCTATLAPGDHPITAVYSGDANIDGSMGALDTSGVPPQSPALADGRQRVSTFGTSIAITQTPASPTIGDVVTFKITVIGGLPGTPTGTVTLESNATTSAPVTLVNGKATISSSALPGGKLIAGTYDVTVAYAGDMNFSATTGKKNITVARAATTLTLSPTSTATAFGQSVGLTATITSLAPFAPISGASGTVKFFDDALELGTFTLGTTGIVSTTVSNLAIGPHKLTAVYSGDLSFLGSTNSPLASVVNKDGTTTTLAASANPAILGAPLTITATVTPVAPGAGDPTGTVTFTSEAGAIGSAVVTSHVATLTLDTFLVGTHTITATYQGDDDFITSTSQPLTQVVAPGATKLAFSAAPSPVPYLGVVTLSAVLPSDARGTVAFSEGTTTIVTLDVDATGKVTTTTTLGLGTHSLVATYSGDMGHDAVTATASVQVTARPTTTALTESSTESKVGDAVTFTATVSTDLGPVTAGEVTFFAGTVALGAPVAVSAVGVATTSITSLPAGTASVTASYTSTIGFGASKAVAVSHVVIAPVEAVPPGESSCGCVAVGVRAPGPLGVVAALALVALVLARRRRAA